MRRKQMLLCGICMLLTVSTGCAAGAPATESSNDSARTLAVENGISVIRINIKYGDVIIRSNRSDNSNPDNDEITVSIGESKYLPEVSVHTEGDTLFVNESKDLPISDTESYPIYLYLPDHPGIRSLSINSEHSNVSLSDEIHIDSLSVFLNVDGNIDIKDAVISDLSLYSLTGPINVNLIGNPDTYDYDLSTEAGNDIILNGDVYDNTNPDSIQPEEQNYVIINHGNSNKIQASTNGELTVQVK